ncbi:MAG: hypothetical protein OXC05_05160 [Halieaceae bacterium]|nr:hypothetical protein [Halieaceae bacterium]
MNTAIAPMVIRGKIIEENLIEFGGRAQGFVFRSPDPHAYVEEIGLTSPDALADLYQLSFTDILDYLEELGQRLVLEDNQHLQQAFEAACATAAMTPPLLRVQYASIPAFLGNRKALIESAEQSIGIAHLEGWVEGSTCTGHATRIRAFGARTVHVIAGNAPLLSAMTVARNAMLRSDAIIKPPSNDPLTAAAIGRQMVEMAPDHPLTRHLSVAYWKGGDEAFESRLYQPRNVEKIIAWGGFASVKHVTRYIQPGLELISLDPKSSASIIGPEAFASEETLADVAQKVAADVGLHNQQGCVNARVVYVLSGTDEQGINQLERLGRLVYEKIQQLNPQLSTVAERYSPELKAHVDTLKLDDDWYSVIGGEDKEGAIIVSRLPAPVDFSAALCDRTANLVPIDCLDEAIAFVDAYTQTVGIYPEALKQDLMDILPLHGAQRIVSLGYATQMSNAAPHDGLEPMRRMCKWILEESADPSTVPPFWSTAGFSGTI